MEISPEGSLLKGVPNEVIIFKKFTKNFHRFESLETRFLGNKAIGLKKHYDNHKPSLVSLQNSSVEPEQRGSVSLHSARL